MQKIKKALLTNEEKNILSVLKKYPDAFLRRYTEGLYRLVDAKINPISNFSRNKILSLVEKEYLELLPDNRFKISN